MYNNMLFSFYLLIIGLHCSENVCFKLTAKFPYYFIEYVIKLMLWMDNNKIICIYSNIPSNNWIIEVCMSRSDYRNSVNEISNGMPMCYTRYFAGKR